MTIEFVRDVALDQYHVAHRNSAGRLCLLLDENGRPADFGQELRRSDYLAARLRGSLLAMDAAFANEARWR